MADFRRLNNYQGASVMAAGFLAAFHYPPITLLFLLLTGLPLLRRQAVSCLSGALLALICFFNYQRQTEVKFFQDYPPHSFQASLLTDGFKQISGYQKVTAKLLTVESITAQTQARGLITLYVSGAQPLYKGQIVKVVKSSLFINQGHYFGSVKKENLSILKFEQPIWAYRAAFKKNFTHYALKRLGPAFGLFNAMITGDRSFLQPLISKRFTEAGLNHLIALSGYHVGVLTSILLLLSQKLHRRQAFIFLMPCLLLYLIISGLQYSLMRAVFMSLITLLCYLFYRRIRSIDLLGLSFITILCFDSGALYSLSFQLSYLAMLGIIIFYQPLNKKLQSWVPLRRFTGELSLGLASQITTGPLLMARFGALYPVGIMAGFFVVPLLAFYMLSCFLCLLVPHPALNQLPLLLQWVLMRLLYFFSYGPSLTL